MATIVLQTAGVLLGGLLGPVGAAIGSAVGALAGYAIDRALIDGTRHEHGPRLSGARPVSGEEGASLPRLYGTARLGGLLIWATRFEEEARTERQGAKGGPRRTTYSYYANVALALCDGPVAGVRRVWADGRELDLDQVEMRVWRGGEAQPADPLIEARQGSGNTPAYRGTAYVVFERFPIGDYGNRIPQFQFEVMRPVGKLNRRIRGVALLPGSTEYGLAPDVVTRTPSPGEVIALNRHVLHGSTDLRASLDELQALCPGLERVALIVTWFGDDLAASTCTIRPKVTGGALGELSQPWMVSGIDRAEAAVVSSHAGKAAYGGTPTDRSVLDAIAEIHARGLQVTLHPFLMMDIPAGNGLTDPNTGAGSTPAYPWRGRITCTPGPGVPGSADQSAEARTQVDAFCGAATGSDFEETADGVAFTGDAGDWGYRRMVLHYARLAAMAGGVDAFLIGSELRGLTRVRDNAGAFPFVEQLCDLAAEVRAILGTGCKLTYGADWSEYFGHQPAEGSADALFHLDALWMHPAIDAVGIDNYMPLSDWRDGDGFGASPDAARGPYDVAALGRAVTGGEGYDWYYASDSARAARSRTPITDGTYGKPWVFRYKDLLGWWSNHHYNRHGGFEADTPTAWVPGAKPIWFTELGCPAVDRGPNQPNVFPDAKSAENALPHGSDGGRADLAPFALGRAQLDRWDGTAESFDATANPVSPVYGGRMVDPARIYFWAWDARPFPAFPTRADVWGDGGNWATGHWLNGRLEGAPVGDVIDAILADFELPAADTSGVEGTVTGYVIPDPSSARGALEPLTDLFGIAAAQGTNGLMFSAEGATAAVPQPMQHLVVPDDEGPVATRIRTADLELPAETVLVFRDQMRDYQSATARGLAGIETGGGVHQIGFPGVLDTGQAAALVDDWCRRKAAAREQVRFALPQTRIDVDAGSLVRLDEALSTGTFLVTDLEIGESRAISARRLRTGRPATWSGAVPELRPIRPTRAGPPLVHFLDLPMLTGSTEPQDQFRVALRARPWVLHATYASPGETGFGQRGLVRAEATVGQLVEALGPGFEGRFDRVGTVVVDLLSGALASVPDLQLFAGANRAAVRAIEGEWEIIQFGTAEEMAPGRWRLSRLLRGRCGTRHAMLQGAGEESPFVLLDGAVTPAGLALEEAGLPLNWRVGPVGYDFGGPTFAATTVAGGMRARRPLPPAHLRATRMPGGDLAVRWVRRGRIDADRGLAGDIPLGEESERYALAVTRDGTLLRAASLAAPQWTYTAAEQAADFALPATATMTVRQVSQAAGPGDAASLSLTIG
jgi:hypothetical protein